MIEIKKEFVKLNFSTEDFQDLYMKWIGKPMMPRADVYNSYYRRYLYEINFENYESDVSFIDGIKRADKREFYFLGVDSAYMSPHGYIGIDPVPGCDLWEDLTNFLYQPLESMPLHINKTLWKGLVSRWRLSLGK